MTISTETFTSAHALPSGEITFDVHTSGEHFTGSLEGATAALLDAGFTGREAAGMLVDAAADLEDRTEAWVSVCAGPSVE